MGVERVVGRVVGERGCDGGLAAVPKVPALVPATVPRAPHLRSVLARGMVRLIGSGWVRGRVFGERDIPLLHPLPPRFPEN